MAVVKGAADIDDGKLVALVDGDVRALTGIGVFWDVLINEDLTMVNSSSNTTYQVVTAVDGDHIRMTMVNNVW